MKKDKIIVVLVILIHFMFLFNLRFTLWPEMLSYPYLKNNGFTLYKDFIYPYPPLLTNVLAFYYKIFGSNLIASKLFIWILILLNDFLILKVVKKITQNSNASLISLIFYVSLQPFLEGNMIWFDNVLVSPILLGFYFYVLWKKDKKSKIFSKEKILVSLMGLSLAIAVFIKQTAIFFPVIFVIYLAFTKVNFARVKYIFLAPAVLTLFLFYGLWSSETIGDFVNWTLVYPLLYWSKFPGYADMSLNSLELKILLVIFLPIVGSLFVNWKKIKKNNFFLLTTVFLGVALVSVYPRFSFFHFQPALAFLSILLGICVSFLKKPWIILIFCLMFFPVIQWPVISSDWGREARFYGVKDIEFAKLIAEKSKTKRVYILGSHSGLYAIGGFLPPKPWVDNFGWYLEISDTQGKILEGWDKDAPEIVIWEAPKSRGNWFDLGVYQPKKITKWIEDNYISEVEIVPGYILWRKK